MQLSAISKALTLILALKTALCCIRNRFLLFKKI